MDMPQNDLDLVRIELHDRTSTAADVLREIQRVLLTHPVACQAAFTALLAEGRRFADTPEGQQWCERLRHSSILRDIRLAFDLSTLGMLEEHQTGPLPSSYLDALFMMAAGGDADAVLNRLFWNEGTSHARSGD